MSEEEAAKFRQLIIEAEVGKLVHAAQTQLDDGSTLGVQVMTPEQLEEYKQQQRHNESERARAAYNRRNGRIADESERLARNY